MTISEALIEHGVTDTTLSNEEKLFLDQQGYLPLQGLLSTAQVNAMNTRLAELAAEEGDTAGSEVHQEVGTMRLSDLVNKDPLFYVGFTHPKVLAGIAHVLKYDLKLSSLNFRAALPGHGLQGLHADWGRLETPGDYQVCNSLWLLDDFTVENGATRIVPGTNRSTGSPGDVMANSQDTHPDEKLLLGKAGDVVIFNSHTWHGGTLNRTTEPRRALHGYFTRRSQTAQLDQQKYLRQSTWEQLSPSQRVVIGVTEPNK